MLRRSLLALAAAASTGSAQAQRIWPNGPIRLVVPFPPGGSVDAVARLLQRPLQQKLGVSVVVENRSGASGSLGNAMVARAAPDGQTFLMASDAYATLPALLPSLGYDAQRDLAPVMLIGTAPMVLCAHRTRPWRSIAALVAAARAEPGQITCGTSGNGTLAHLAMQQMQQAGGFRTTHVPYRGGAPLVQAVIAGELDLAIASMAPINRFITDGTLVPLVQPGGQRSPQLADVPTAQETGFAGVDTIAYWCLLAPAAVPPPVLAAFHAALRDTLAEPELRERLASTLGIEAVASDPEALGRLLEREMSVWAAVIRENGIQAD